MKFLLKFNESSKSHQTSRTFFVSGQAQHALHLGFSGVAGAGVVAVGASTDFDSELPISV